MQRGKIWYMRVFLDTNVLIDCLADRDEFAKPACTVIEMCRNNKLIGGISSKSVLDAFHLLRKTLGTGTTRHLLRAYCRIFTIISVNSDDVIKALDNVDFTDFEDCVQSECAEKFNADYIITRNAKDFKLSKISAVDANEFLQRWEIK